MFLLAVGALAPGSGDRGPFAAQAPELLDELVTRVERAESIEARETAINAIIRHEDRPLTFSSSQAQRLENAVATDRMPLTSDGALLLGTLYRYADFSEHTIERLVERIELEAGQARVTNFVYILEEHQQKYRLPDASLRFLLDRLKDAGTERPQNIVLALATVPVDDPGMPAVIDAFEAYSTTGADGDAPRHVVDGLKLMTDAPLTPGLATAVADYAASVKHVRSRLDALRALLRQEVPASTRQQVAQALSEAVNTPDSEFWQEAQRSRHSQGHCRVMMEAVGLASDVPFPRATVDAVIRLSRCELELGIGVLTEIAGRQTLTPEQKAQAEELAVSRLGPRALLDYAETIRVRSTLLDLLSPPELAQDSAALIGIVAGRDDDSAKVRAALDIHRAHPGLRLSTRQSAELFDAVSTTRRYDVAFLGASLLMRSEDSIGIKTRRMAALIDKHPSNYALRALLLDTMTPDELQRFVARATEDEASDRNLRTDAIKRLPALAVPGERLRPDTESALQRIVKDATHLNDAQAAADALRAWGEDVPVSKAQVSHTVTGWLATLLTTLWLVCSFLVPLAFLTVVVLTYLGPPGGPTKATSAIVAGFIGWLVFGLFVAGAWLAGSVVAFVGHNNPPPPGHTFAVLPFLVLSAVLIVSAVTGVARRFRAATGRAQRVNSTS